jgi:hypothetical protein
MVRKIVQDDLNALTGEAVPDVRLRDYTGTEN